MVEAGVIAKWRRRSRLLGRLIEEVKTSLK